MQPSSIFVLALFSSVYLNFPRSADTQRANQYRTHSTCISRHDLGLLKKPFHFGCINWWWKWMSLSLYGEQNQSGVWFHASVPFRCLDLCHCFVLTFVTSMGTAVYQLRYINWSRVFLFLHMKDTSKIHVESEHLSSHKSLELASGCSESVSADTCLIRAHSPCI